MPSDDTFGSDLERFFDGQHPFRPDHPDFERLRTVVDKMEAWKHTGVDPKVVYDKIVDVYSMSYLATQRAGMNAPKPNASPIEIIELMANSWAEGFAYGILFQQAGGTRQEPQSD